MKLGKLKVEMSDDGMGVEADEFSVVDFCLETERSALAVEDDGGVVGAGEADGFDPAAGEELGELLAGGVDGVLLVRRNGCLSLGHGDLGFEI